MRAPVRWLADHHVHRHPLTLVALLVLIAALQLGATCGVIAIAGLNAVRHVLPHVSWPWFVVAVVAVASSYVGFVVAFRGVLIAEGGWTLPSEEMSAVTLAAWVGFLNGGGARLDKQAALAAGACERDATVRVAAMAALEQAVLALGGCAASIAVLLAGLHKPPPDFTVPWAVLPIPGFVVGFWAASRWADRWRDGRGWRAGVSVFLDTALFVRGLFRHPLRNDAPIVGMALFWLGDMAALWLCLRAFGLAMDPGAFVVAYATGLLFTRRTAPFAGAGVLMLVLPLTLWYSGASLAVSVVGVFAYRVFTVWLPLPFSLSGRRRLARLVSADRRMEAARV